MTTYIPPIRDMMFVYDEVLEGAQLQNLPGYDDVDIETVEAILEEAGKFSANELLPLNRQGDEEGCHFEAGKVTTPKGFKPAYQAFSEAGWGSVAMDADYGGQGLPKTLHLLTDEMICSANMSFSLYPGLTNGAYAALTAYASDDIKQTYFPKMAEGTWSASMCLTEPHCGTDLGMLRSKAIPQEDGSYRISGTKIFITAGEHDLTENILHLVLARTPDAPDGVKGISLFLVPKILLNDDGSLGEANAVSCGSIEHKMGIKASATCVMNFDDAKGFLIGELNKGMRAMFKMMNDERVAVGIQGIGIGEMAYQAAVEYARERIQGRSPSGAKQPQKAADPLTVHPDVRRMLLTARANTEGSRALATWLGMQLDISNKEADPDKRQAAEGLVALLTPIAKAYLTDLGFESAVLCQQVFGGHGYIREHGMEQLVRDARITQIYEGTNGIQAMDLVGRKLAMENGRYLKDFIAIISGFITEHENNPQLAEFTQPLAESLNQLQQATAWLQQAAAQNPEEIGAAAYDYMRLFALVTLAYLWARMAKAALVGLAESDNPFYQSKLRTARFFYRRILPQVGMLLNVIQAGADCLMDFDEDQF